MLSEKKKEFICKVYQDCETADEREETVIELALHYKVSTMEIRQILQLAKVYFAKEGKTQKEQYANALYAVTGIQPKEWMKLTFKSQQKLMDIFKQSNKDEN